MTVPLIAVDIGNSSTKLGIFTEILEDQWPRPSSVLELNTLQKSEEIFLEQLPPQPHHWSVGSVHREAEERLAAFAAELRPQDTYRRLSWKDLPLEIEVEQPRQVGIDRLLGAVAANYLRQENRPAIVVDAGTAITVDAISSAGAFIGGAILPGAGLIARALSEETDLLPLAPASFAQPPPAVGKSTESAIGSGLYWGMLGAVRELIDRIQKQWTSQGSKQQAPQIFLTGGDAEVLTDYLGPYAQHHPSLVLSGIAISVISGRGR